MSPITKSKPKQIQGFQSALDFIKLAGFSHLKVELEGQLDRESTEEFYDEDNCENWLLENVSSEARDALSFYRFYNDGSVDSEFTFTLPIEKAKYVTEFIDAFREMGNETGTLDVLGAGMHIAVLTDSNYREGTALNRTKARNFKTQMGRLLPAMYFVASCTHFARGLEYRRPGVSAEKSAAIAVRNDHIEYRLFETCYDKPASFKDYVQTIAKSLTFYHDPKKQVRSQGYTYRFGEANRTLGRFFNTTKKLEVLEKTLAFVKPARKSIKTLYKERNFNVTRDKLKRKEAKREARFRAEYREYQKNAEEQLREYRTRELTDNEQVRINQLVNGGWDVDTAFDDVIRRPQQPTYQEYRQSRSRDLAGDMNYAVTV